MAASSNAENGKLWPPPIEKHFINVLVEEEIKGNMPSRQFKKANPKCKEFCKKGLNHYGLLGRLFNVGTTTGFLQISSSQPAPNSDEKRELNAAFLTYGVHVTMEADNGDDMEEPPTPVEGQGNRRVGKLPSQTASLARKKRKGGSLGEMTDAINNFTEMSRQRLSKDSGSRPQFVDTALRGDRFSMDRAIEILNSIENVDDFTIFKILKELYNPDSKAAFISPRPDRRRSWADLVGSLM
nr:hypothetical protein CFP56_26964 [Quercus suber]